VNPAETIGHRRRRLLELADELGNVSAACRQMGVKRARYYEWKQLADVHGPEALTPEPRRRSLLEHNLVGELLDLVITEPKIGCRQYADRLFQRGYVVSKSSVHQILNESRLGRPSQRMALAEATTGRSTGVRRRPEGFGVRDFAPPYDHATSRPRDVEPRPVTHALSETLATAAPRAPGAPRTHDARALRTVGLRDARRSGRWLTTWLAGPFAQALARLVRWLALGLGLLLVLAAVTAVLIPGIYTALFFHVLSLGVSLLSSTVAWTILVPICVSLVLSEVVWTTSVELLHAWRSSESLAEAPVASDDLASGRPPGPRPVPSRAARRLARSRTEPVATSWLSSFGPKLADTPVHALVRALLLLAIAASVMLLAWAKPQPWPDVLVIAVTVALATRKRPWLERRSVAAAGRALAPPVRYLTGRIPVLDRTRALWRELPVAERATIPMLVLLNVLIAMTVEGTTLFVVMAGVDLIALNRLSRRPPETQEGIASLTEQSSAKPVRPRGNAPLPNARRRRDAWLAERAQPRVAAVVGILAVVWIGYSHPGPLLIPAVVVLGLAIPFTSDVNREQAITMVLAIAVAAATVDYVSWRLEVTNWQGWWIAVPLLFAEALGAVHVLGFQFTIWPRPLPKFERTEDPTQNPIFIFIPTVNEEIEVLEPTVQGCIAARGQYLARHPHGRVTIVLCNDRRAANVPGWEEIDAFAQRLGIDCVTRSTGGGAKAGNIENARHDFQATGDALVVIFDADQVPKPDFLLKTITPFGDPNVGWVQTGQYYANLTNPVSRWADDQQSMFYNLLCPGKATLNSAFICGTNVVIRAAALDAIGGLPQNSVTEDFAASVVLHPKWRSVYLSEVLATGLGPLDIQSYFRQQGRWALGTLEVFRTHWRDILLPSRHGLRMGQRVQYFLACTHYLCGLRDLIYVVSPMVFIATGVPAVHTPTLTVYLWHFIPYGSLALLALWYSARGVTGLRGIIIGFGSFPALLGSLLAVILRRKVAFAVTSKKRREDQSFSHVRVHVAFALLCLAALVFATQVRGQQATSLFISVLWVVYSLFLLGSFLWLAYADAGFHAATARVGGTDEVAAKLPYRSRLLRRRDVARPAWNLGLAALLACPLLVGKSLGSLPIFASSKATPFVISREAVGAPYIGVSLPAALVKTRPLALQSALRARLSIVGRTQDIADRFDTSWAERLAANGARPWITLEFGVFGPHQRRPLDASLPAIINGVHDGDIARWASEIRDFGKPVYLTILRHVDRNWSLSSAVAGGGIPEDARRAWKHVQSIFRSVGASNVVWVWAPADPIHDQAFAPPPSTIDVVLQSFINYPGTRWGDPNLVLHSLMHRYPGKPLFVEASIAGRATAKAAWLASLRQALDSCSQLYAFLYHEGGPGLTPTPAQAKSWSVASDPLSLAAMRGAVASLRAERRAR
jgi:cellulose synthase/poly-beta-1,6-N-acetylglucosamine synthase-like glycosyltransferase